MSLTHSLTQLTGARILCFYILSFLWAYLLTWKASIIDDCDIPPLMIWQEIFYLLFLRARVGWELFFEPRVKSITTMTALNNKNLNKTRPPTFQSEVLNYPSETCKWYFAKPILWPPKWKDLESQHSGAWVARAVRSVFLQWGWGGKHCLPTTVTFCRFQESSGMCALELKVHMDLHSTHFEKFYR